MKSRVKQFVTKLGHLRTHTSLRTMLRLALHVAGFLKASVQSRIPGFSASSRQEGLSSFVPSIGNRSRKSRSVENIDAPDDPTDCGVIYARVSSKKQVEEGKSLEEQVRNLKQIAEKRGIHLVTEPIEDGGETGTNFDREGIRKVWEIANRDKIEYVLVDDVDRVGRHPAETIFYLYELRVECGVTIITSESGELDVDEFEGLSQVFLKSLSAQISNENRARRAQASSIEKFKQKNWSVFYDSPPLGYVETEDDWLEINVEEAKVVEEAFQTFLRLGHRAPYSKTVRRVDGLPEDWNSNKLRNMLENSVYIGEPSVESSPPGEPDESRVVVPDDSLQIVPDTTFSRVQEKIKKIHKRYSTESDDTMDLDSCVGEFGWRAVEASSPIVVLECPDCRGSVVRNGQRKLTGHTSHNYKCDNEDCGRQRTWPTQAEFDRMSRFDQEEGGAAD